AIMRLLYARLLRLRRIAPDVVVRCIVVVTLRVMTPVAKRRAKNAGAQRSFGSDMNSERLTTGAARHARFSPTAGPFRPGAREKHDLRLQGRRARRLPVRVATIAPARPAQLAERDRPTRGRSYPFKGRSFTR